VNPQRAIAAVVHGQLGQRLASVFSAGGQSPVKIVVSLDPKDKLLNQLAEPGDDPPRFSLAFGLDILSSSLSIVLDALPVPLGGPLGGLQKPNLSQLLDNVRKALEGQLGLLERQRDVIAQVIVAARPADIGAAIDALFQGVVDGIGGTETKNSVLRLREYIGRDVDTALPFATMMTAVQQALGNAAGIPESVEQALLAYFFKAHGYTTLDGEYIVSPVHLSDVGRAAGAVVTEVAGGADARAAAVASFTGLLGKTSAERYIRDTTRVIVESAYDSARGFRDRDSATPGQKTPGLYSVITAKLTNQAKFVAWFRGFSSMAESAAMRAVEIGTQGVSEFQTNPLIAAAAGSFAGTVARKLAQDSFLAVLREDLHA
jgi:hypothetical protein